MNHSYGCASCRKRKKPAKIGIKTVPNPKPEKRVTIEIKKEMMQIITHSMFIMPLVGG